MKVLRTPDHCFADLPEFPYSPKYTNIDHQSIPLRIHYLDEGPTDAETILLLHGEPSWSFIYRKMVSGLTQKGFRIIAPDLVGFGKSDKFAAQSDYTYENHVSWMTMFLNNLELNDITLVCQDWGGLIGLRLVANMPDRFARVLATNTFLPTGEHKASEAFENWKKFSQETPTLNVGKIIASGCVSELPDEVIAAYDAPFPDETYKAGARIFPMLVPTTPDAPGAAENREAWKTLCQFNKPFITAFGDQDPVTKGGDRVLQKLIPGCKGQNHQTVNQGGHFIQEDQGVKLSEVVAEFIATNPR